VEAGTVSDEPSARVWIGDCLEFNLGRFEAPLLSRLLEAWQGEDAPAVATWNELYLAGREAAELRAETVQMGHSMLRLLRELGDFPPQILAGLALVHEPCFPAVWSAAAAAWRIPHEDAITAYLWAWLENQTIAALKVVPLGQSAGQRIVLELGARVPALAQRALTLGPEAWSNLAPGFGIACSRHETQYSRLFRS